MLCSHKKSVCRTYTVYKATLCSGRNFVAIQKCYLWLSATAMQNCVYMHRLANFYLPFVPILKPYIFFSAKCCAQQSHGIACRKVSGAQRCMDGLLVQFLYKSQHTVIPYAKLLSNFYGFGGYRCYIPQQLFLYLCFNG